MSQNTLKTVKIVTIWFLINIILASTITVIAQGQSEPAEIIGTIDTQNYRIPSINIGNFTIINITLRDVFGINWTRLKSKFPTVSQYIWPIIHPSWKRFLGYTSLRLDPEIIQGDPRGWYVKVDPTSIAQTDQGRIYQIKLYVQTADIAVDYSVVVGIKVTRLDVFGNEYGQSTIYVPVKASSLNNVKMTEASATTQTVSPYSHGYFDVTIHNFGYYRDMFQLHFETENNLIVCTSNQVVVLKPGDSQNLRIEFLTPEKFYDIGTPNTIKIYVTSASDPNPELIGTLVVITQGEYISPFVGIILAPIIVIILLIFIFFFFIKTRRDKNKYGKPEKPWKLPEEQEHLRELRKTDKKAYDQERQMMNDEYKSAMLFYRDYRQTLKAKPIEETPPKEEQPKRPLLKLPKRSEKPPKVEEKKVEAIVPAEDKTKVKALAKIQKEQEKALKRKRE